MNCNVECGYSYIIGLFKSFKKKPAPTPEPPKPVTPVVPTPAPQPVPQPVPQPEKDRNVVSIRVNGYDADGCYFDDHSSGNSDNGSDNTYLNYAYVWVNYTTYNAAGEAIESKRERRMIRGFKNHNVDLNCGRAIQATISRFPKGPYTVDFFNGLYQLR